MRVINQSIKYNKMPSEIARIEDEYTSFCFDEACMYIIRSLEDGKEPKWSEDKLSKDDVRSKALCLAEQLRKGGN